MSNYFSDVIKPSFYLSIFISLFLDSIAWGGLEFTYMFIDHEHPPSLNISATNHQDNTSLTRAPMPIVEIMWAGIHAITFMLIWAKLHSNYIEQSNTPTCTDLFRRINNKLKSTDEESSIENQTAPLLAVNSA